MARNHQSNGADELAKEELYCRFSRRGQWHQRFRRFRQGLTWVVVIHVLLGSKRLLDFCLALILICLLSPLFAIALLLFRTPAMGLQRLPRVGRRGMMFYEYSFAIPDGRIGRLFTSLNIHRLPVLLNILRGHMSFIGPRPLAPGKLSLRQRVARRRQEVRPGLICLWWIRERANIGYGSEIEADGEYVDTHSVSGDIGLALRAIPALMYGKGTATVSDPLTLLGIPINNLTMHEALNAIVAKLSGDTPSQICFVNADCANIAYGDREYLEVLRHAALTLADGIGLKLAGKILGRDIRQNINGTDLLPYLCEVLQGTEHGLFLLGAGPGIAAGVRNWIVAHYPDVRIKGWRHGYFTPDEEEEVIRQIAASGATLLLVAFGTPWQDLWIRQHLHQTGVKVAMGVGGLFDFYSGRMPRAPQWIREIGCEWLYRFSQEPGRLWKRYLVGNGIFLFRVIKEKIRGISL